MIRYVPRAGLLLAAMTLLLLPGPGRTQEGEATLGSLRGIRPPAPPAAEYDALVKDKAWLAALGKALFWDNAVGSDGLACASCHFHAGADPRLVNQLNPGLLGQPFADDKFGGLGSGAGLTRGGLLDGTGKKAQPNMALEASDFPFHQLANIRDRNSAILYESNDVVSSQGAFDGQLLSLPRKLKFRTRTRDFCVDGLDDIFQAQIKGQVRQVRKVEPRNSPTVINAAYYFRNFWDGRASNVFNGVGVLGRREVQNDPAARIVVLDGGGSPRLEALELRNMSLASQAAGPPNSTVEMACADNSFAKIGRKLLTQAALTAQQIDATDSVFGNQSAIGNQIRNSGKGLKQSYRMLVQKAFADHLWAGAGTYRISPGGELVADQAGYSQDELNFSLFFGLAIDAYERTLVSDRTPFDRYAEGKTEALNDRQKQGLELFQGKAKCASCHAGPLFSSAAVPPRQRQELVETMPMGDGGTALYDGGFYNIGVRPTFEDIGLGAEVGGAPLSFARQYVERRKVDSFPNPEGDRSSRLAVDGAFKTPTLRNVALTAPYFHNGGEATLKGVVEFYNRGGNRRDLANGDTSGTGPLGRSSPVGPNQGGSNLAPDIVPLNLSNGEVNALVAFLKSLTDQRVACHAAPFDHPELLVTDGHVAGSSRGRAKDDSLRLLPVGRGGYPAGLCDPNTGDLFDRNLVGGMLQRPQ
ncbi:cytochrome-c peroxidase [Geminicoccus roseus]|uniref:cytochrome-c peroxidase n=1 Tax=Geminicoccus roseus TaxID=404900 RepID=UPI000403CC50|nr:cytochrome c peroxidase [Geminicoccus roseus]